MPYPIKMKAEHRSIKFTSCTPSIGKDLRVSGTALGASFLCLSLLVGCASNPDQEQAVDSVESTIQSEDAIPTASSSPTEQASVETKTSSETTSNNTASAEAAPQDVTAEVSSTAPQVTAEPIPEPSSNTAPETPSNTPANTAATAEEPVAIEESQTAAELSDQQPSEQENTLTATDANDGNTIAAINEDTVAVGEPTNNEAASAQPVIRTNKNIGKSYGIWTLKDAGNGFCKLKTPTLQIGNDEYSSQIWMDIEEQQVIVNAYMALDIKHPKTGIQIDNQALLPFAEKVNSTRAVVSGDITTQLSAGKELRIFINGKEVGKQVLKRNVKLTNMNAAISALRSCGN